MVNKSSDIQAKFAMKYDAYVLMLRAKHMKYFSALKYAQTVTKQYTLEIAMNQAINDYGLAWGQRGRFFDLTEKMFAGKEVTLQKWLDSDLPEELYNKMPSIFANVQSLYGFCKYPTSKLLSRITVFPIPQDVLFPINEDYTEQTTKLSESEKLDLPSENSTASILEAQICVHHNVSALAPFLDTPRVFLSEMGLFPYLNSPITSCNIYQHSAPLTNLSRIFASNEKSAPLSNQSSNPSLYNKAPALNISVINS